jgi:hypothetical protein
MNCSGLQPAKLLRSASRRPGVPRAATSACSISKAAMILVREGNDPADEDELSDEAIRGANQQMPQLLCR